MTLLRNMAVAALCLFASANAEDKKPAKFDAEKIVGKYSIVSGEKFGKAEPAEMFKNATFEIEKDKMTMPTPDGKFVFAYKIDAATEPAGLDLEITEGPIGKGSKSKGIIKLDDDTLTICYPAMEGDRPKEFKTSDDKKTMLFVMKKAK